MSNGAVTLHLGYGRTRAGRAGTGFGFNPYGLRMGKALWHDTGLEAKKTSGSYLFANTQNQQALDTRRHIIHAADIAEYRKNPESVHEGAEVPPRTLTMYPEWKYEGYAWGMAIDLTSCTGCSACVVGCQAENNIPVVGKDQVAPQPHDALAARGHLLQRRREQSRRCTTSRCRACTARRRPCELVCPVQATTHSSEGLNDMVYNRCVGTRYCSNNCPYKVRRFNFYLYSDYETPSLKLLHNPDVTVRSRGVMEKCTYCVQRINAAKIDAEKQDRQGSRRRDPDGVPGGLSDRGDHIRRYQRPEQPRVADEGGQAELRLAGGTEHAPADDVPGGAAESEPGDRGLEPWLTDQT